MRTKRTLKVIVGILIILSTCVLAAIYVKQPISALICAVVSLVVLLTLFIPKGKRFRGI